MKILEINKFYFNKGGADKHFLDVLDLLNKHGHETAVFSMRHSKNQKNNWEKYFVSTVGYNATFTLWQKIKGIFRMFYSFEAQRKINNLLDDFKPDIVHIHNIYHQLSPAILFAIKKRGIPIIMTVHDYKLICPNYYLRSEKKDLTKNDCNNFWKFVSNRYFKNSYLESFLVALEWRFHNFLGTYEKNIDAYIVPSEFLKDKLTGYGIKEDKIVVLPHFIPRQDPSLTPLFTEPVPVEKYALYFGRISEEKGVDNLISIFENLKDDTRLYLAGGIEGDFKINQSEKIKYLGELEQDELGKYINKSEFIISASALPETFGLIALEAISSGKPFIGLKSGAYPEIIENKINGWLVNDTIELRDIIKGVLRGELNFNNSEMQKLAAEKYNEDAYYIKLLQIFKKALSLDKYEI